MQEIKREVLVQKASEMLASGTVDRVLGWKVGEFDYDVTPAVFTSADELEKDFVWGDFCGANFSKYLIKETEKSESKVLVFLKPCDTYSFNQLLTEHRFDREKAYAVGIPCSGMLDINKIRNLADGISSIDIDGDEIDIHTLYDGVVKTTKDTAQLERCACCKSKKHVAYDELIGDDGEVTDSSRFDEVERLEKMTPDERYAFWQNELFTLSDAVPTAANVREFVPSIYRCICSTESSSRILTSFTASIRQERRSAAVHP